MPTRHSTSNVRAMECTPPLSCHPLLFYPAHVSRLIDWRYVHDYFAAAGVTNAVWAMDFSASAAWEEWHPLFAAM